MNGVATEIFNRYEEKYIITDEVYRQLKPQLEKFMELDEHSRNGSFYTICNIYYDTPDNDLIRKSIERPTYKEKLRLRSYGVVSPSDNVYLEIKKKYNGYVFKRRLSITLNEANCYLENRQRPESMSFKSEQVLNEIDFMVSRYSGLQPAVFLSYDRNALFGVEDKSFRITFDTNIRSRRYDLSMDKGIYGDLLLPQDQWVMEVKIRNVVPLWLAELLSEHKIYPVSFSKYGTEYKKTLSSQNNAVSREYLKLYA